MSATAFTDNITVEDLDGEIKPLFLDIFRYQRGNFVVEKLYAILEMMNDDIHEMDIIAAKDFIDEVLKGWLMDTRGN